MVNQYLKSSAAINPAETRLYSGDNYTVLELSSEVETQLIANKTKDENSLRNLRLLIVALNVGTIIMAIIKISNLNKNQVS